MHKIVLILCLCLSTSFSFSQDTIKVAVYNTFMMPSHVKKSKQKTRAKLIGSYFANGQKADIICFQEMFKKKCRTIMIDSLSKQYPYYKMANKKRFLKTNSGLMIFSKYPIKSHHFVEYKQKIGIEKWATKGVQKVSVSLVNGDSLVINNTHLQSTQKEKAKQVRVSQFNQIKAINSGVKNEIYCGDFNVPKTNKEHYAQMINTLTVEDTDLATQTTCTSGCPNNSWISKKEIERKPSGEILDYIFKHKNSTLNIIDKQVYEPKANNMDYSDHSLLIAKLIIK